MLGCKYNGAYHIILYEAYNFILYIPLFAKHFTIFKTEVFKKK